jgi:glutaconate CoA-transferase subunit A
VLLAESLAQLGTIDPDEVSIPAPYVSAVVHVPYGAHPTAVYGRYDYDRSQLEAYAAASRAGGEIYERFLNDYVRGVESQEQYLARAGVVV